MKFILKNVEKIIFGIFVLLFITVFVVARLGAIRRVEKVNFPKANKTVGISEEERVKFENYDKIIGEARKPESLGKYEFFKQRDFFHEYEEAVLPEQPFIVKEIKQIPLNIIYKGLIELSKDKVIAQVNFNDKTYFLKEGESFGEYTLRETTKDFCVISSNENKEMKLPYRQEIFGDEYEAVLYDTKTKNLFNIKKDFKIREYQVLDIKSGHVVLLGKNGDTITLKKGEE
ncbi:MAG: hypothetical protein ABH836_08620 [Candidatus Omnitrophota bacterium]